MKKEFTLTRSLLSSYYVAVMISYFLFKLIPDWIVGVWTNWLISFLKAIFGIQVQTNGALWLSLIFICFIIVFLIRRIVVEVLDLHSKEMAFPDWQNWTLFGLVFGFFIYTVNVVFTSQPMPAEWFPEVLIKLLGGGSNTYGQFAVLNAPLEEKNTWTIVPWLWTVGPWVFMLFTTIAAKFQTGDK